MRLHLSKYFIIAVFFVVSYLASIQTVWAQPIALHKYNIQGINLPLTRLVEARLKGIEPNTAASLESLLADAKHVIYEVLEAQGYFHAHIKQEVRKTTDGESTIHYIISKGPQILMTHLSIQLLGEGQADPILQQLMKTLSRQQGSAMTSQNYQTIKATLYQSTIAEGYLNAAWQQHTVAIDLEQNTAQVTLILDTKMRYRIGSIQFLQNKNLLSTAFIKRYLMVQSGDPYRLHHILQAQTLLRNSGYFEKALIHIPTEYTNSNIPLSISLTAAAKYYTLLSLGIRSDLGIQATFEGCIRQLNQRGHQFSVMIKAARDHFTSTGLYKIPARLPAIQNHYIHLEYKGEHPEINTCGWRKYVPNGLPTENPTVILKYIFTRQYFKWQWTPSVALYYEKFKPDLSQTHTPYAGLIFDGILNNIQTNWLKDQPNYKLHFEAQGTSWPFSCIPFVALTARGVYFGRLPEWIPASYFILRGRCGSLLTPSLPRIPRSLRFYAGGYHYPRGHKKYELGAYTAGGGLEMRIHLIGLFYLNPFFEMNYDTHNFQTIIKKGNVGTGICLWYPHIGHIEISGIRRINPDASESAYGIIAKISTDLE